MEDWSDKRDLTTRLTPYNWTFVDKVKVEHNGIQHEVHVPRRCMHCDNPTCMKLCPFSAISKESTGAVSIDDGVCFGGAKCRDVCPWGIPQRQAGVGLYLQVAPDLAGGGVMYKCDLCSDLLAVGKKPACIQACPREALTIGPREEIQALARKKAQDIGGYVYGDLENGGTSTLYISSVPFEKIDQAIKADKKQKEDNSPGRPGMPVKVDNYLESEKGLFYSALLAPFAGAAAAGITAYRTLNGDSAKSSSPNPVNPGEEENMTTTTRKSKRETILRQSLINRFVHWTTALAIFLLILTGFGQMPLYNRYNVTKLPGAEWLGDYFITISLHYLAAVLLIFVVFFHIVNAFIRKQFDIFPRRGDIKESYLIIKAMFTKGQEPPSDKYLAEQRLAYFLLVLMYSCSSSPA